MTTNDPLTNAGEEEPADDHGGRRDQVADHSWWVDLAIVVAVVLLLLMAAEPLWLSLQEGGGCPPAHQALGHC